MGQEVEFPKPENVDVITALEMIRVGIVPTSSVSPVGTIIQLHGNIPVTCLGERTREQFFEAIRATYSERIAGFLQCPEKYKFEAIEAVHKAQMATTTKRMRRLKHETHSR